MHLEPVNVTVSCKNIKKVTKRYEFTHDFQELLENCIYQVKLPENGTSECSNASCSDGIVFWS